MIIVDGKEGGARGRHRWPFSCGKFKAIRPIKGEVYANL